MYSSSSRSSGTRIIIWARFINALNWVDSNGLFSNASRLISIFPFHFLSAVNPGLMRIITSSGSNSKTLLLFIPITLNVLNLRLLSFHLECLKNIILGKGAKLYNGIYRARCSTQSTHLHPEPILLLSLVLRTRLFSVTLNATYFLLWLTQFPDNY